MSIKASEISELIKARIQNFTAATEARNVGTVVTVTDGICRIHGLQDAMQGEMLEFPGNTFGLALNLERDSVGAVVLGDYEHISEGDTVKCTGRILEVPVGTRADRPRRRLRSASPSTARARSRRRNSTSSRRSRRASSPASP